MSTSKAVYDLGDQAIDDMEARRFILPSFVFFFFETTGEIPKPMLKLFSFSNLSLFGIPRIDLAFFLRPLDTLSPLLDVKALSSE
mmetsp:Transcript_30653/g.73526  ORF Transcript_30653/g.73526 Transcript_30653/m.73526 type:complete len:85 (+) Transcript_30653:342-596(+)